MSGKTLSNEGWTEHETLWLGIHELVGLVGLTENISHTYGVITVDDGGPPVLVHVQRIVPMMTQTIANITIAAADEHRLHDGKAGPRRLIMGLASHDRSVIGSCQVRNVPVRFLVLADGRRGTNVRVNGFARYESSREAIAAHTAIEALVGEENCKRKPTDDHM